MAVLTEPVEHPELGGQGVLTLGSEQPLDLSSLGQVHTFFIGT